MVAVTPWRSHTLLTARSATDRPRLLRNVAHHHDWIYRDSLTDSREMSFVCPCGQERRVPLALAAGDPASYLKDYP